MVYQRIFVLRQCSSFCMERKSKAEESPSRPSINSLTKLGIELRHSALSGLLFCEKEEKNHLFSNDVLPNMLLRSRITSVFLVLVSVGKKCP